jgi:hypothetical protein
VSDYDKVLESAVNRLPEAFDSVVVIATYQTEEGSYTVASCGRGNVFAQMGSVEEWLRYRRHETPDKETEDASEED